MENEGKFFLIQATKIKTRTEDLSYALLDGRHSTYDQAIREAERNLTGTSQEVLVVEVRGRCFGSLLVKNEKIP